MLKSKKYLHLIKEPPDGLALEFLNRENILKRSTIILIGDGVYCENIKSKDIYLVKEDAEERGIETKYPLITYDEVVKKIFEYQKVYLW